MSGKAYTMKEMKSIVDYLVEHKAYSETKGRKMWVAFASSQMTTRTWQSLKETFIKRILPDIQNPYYKLTMEQVRSFKTGQDVEAKRRNKLDIITASDDSTANGHIGTNGEEPTSTSKEVDLPSGEDIKSAQITRNRSSVETLVLDDPYYSNAEEILNVLENTAETDINKELHKPLKDCLTFEQSEPFNIDAMRVLQDFASDSEGSVNSLRMEIDENPPDTNNQIEIQDSENTPDLPNNPIEAEVNVMEFGKETEDSIDQQPTQAPDSNESVPDNNRTDADESVPEHNQTDAAESVLVNNHTDTDDSLPDNQTKADHTDSKNKEQFIINDQPVVISDQSDVNDESDRNMDTDAVDKSNVNNDASDVKNTASEVNNQIFEVNNFQAPEQTKGTEDKQDKVVEKDTEKIQTVTPVPEKSLVTKTITTISPETVQTDTDKTILSDKEKPDAPKKIKMSDTIPNSNLTVNTPSNLTDSIIPNNQEALNEVTNDQTKLQVATSQDKTKNSRKRSLSHESETNKKIKLDKKAINKDETDKKSVVNQTKEDQTHITKMNSEDIFTHLVSQENKDTNKPIQDETNEIDSNENIEKDEAINNPCLKSVSLYAEQFNRTKLLDTDSEVETAEQSYSPPKLPETSSKCKTEFRKNPIVLKSHSETDDNNQNKANVSKPVDKVKENVRKESALAKLFGFGPVSRKRRMSHRRSRMNRHSLNTDSDSSEWTSDSEDEYISPPRGRRHRQAWKYLKPKSAKILSLQEQGGLFVMHGKRLYPLIKNGRNVMNYVNLRDERDSDEAEDSYWRQKYVQEKIRADDLEKQLKSKKVVNKKSSISDKSDVPLERISPILQSNTTLRNATSKKMPNESTNPALAVNDKEKEVETVKPSQEKLKICFSRDNQEVQLEGYWPQIHPALQQVVELLHNGNDSSGKTENAKVNQTKEKPNETPTQNTKRMEKSEDKEMETVEIDSGKTTPIIPSIDTVTQEKVQKLENEIFKEIEKRAKEEEPKLSETSNINVTKRGQPKRSRQSKLSSSSSTNTAENQSDISKPATRGSRKSSKIDKRNESTSKQIQEDESTAKEVQNEESSTSKDVQKQDNSTSKEDPKLHESTFDEVQNQDESISKQVQNEESTSKLVKKQNATIAKAVEKSDEAASKTTEAVVMKRPSRTPKRLLEETPLERRISTRRSTSRKSEQIDEDEIRYKLPPKQKVTNPTVNKKRSSQHPAPIPEDTSLRSVESTQGYQDSDASPMQTKRKKKPSFKVYKSKKLVQRKSLSNLTDILSSDSSNSSYFIPLRKSQSTLNSVVYKTDSYELLMPKEKAAKLLDPINENNTESKEVKHFNSLSKDEERYGSSNIIIEICSSSNVSLPLSPELSVVENLTLSREMIKPNISLNEAELNKKDFAISCDENTNYDKYMISNVDVSCPLMEQECGLQNSSENSNKKLGPVSDPLNDNVATVTMDQKSISETINKKLHDLLLESAKKISNKDENMEVDDINVQTKAKPKKRSSTPRKRNTTKRKSAQVNSLIEEEYMETCSFAGRISCPPVITVLPPDENANFAKTSTDKKNKNKKDIIKVKIQRPKSRTRDKGVSKNSTKSSITDSGINETNNFSEMFLKVNDSVDLIHNHSDTCLNANECIGDSLEFIECSKSVISLNSNSSDSELKRLMGTTRKSVDTFSNEAPDISALTKRPNMFEEIFRSPPSTPYHSPAETMNSLITEDLSDETPPQPTQWYLLSDDESKTQFHDAHRSFGSNLNQIFTSCAVPNLSTITEKSVDSRKVNLDGDSQNCDSESLL